VRLCEYTILESSSFGNPLGTVFIFGGHNFSDLSKSARKKKCKAERYWPSLPFGNEYRGKVSLVQKRHLSSSMIVIDLLCLVRAQVVSKVLRECSVCGIHI
jgi:hypothetical protein